MVIVDCDVIRKWSRMNLEGLMSYCFNFKILKTRNVIIYNIIPCVCHMYESKYTGSPNLA